MIICSPQLGLSPKSILGGEVFDVEILSGLSKKGVKVHIIVPKNLPYPKDSNLSVTYLPFVHFPAFLFNILVIPYLFKINNKQKIQILRLHQPQFLFIAAIIFKIFNKDVKTVATYHQFNETNFGPFSKWINNYWDLIVCDSEKVKNKLINSYHVSLNKILVVHNGVPQYLKPEKKDNVLVKKYNLKGKTVLLFMGLFIARKNPLFLLDLIKVAIKSNPDIVLMFLGKGPLKEEILSKAKQLNVEKNIRLIEPVFDQEKTKIHNLADFFVHPSLDEGFALAPLEAMACGKPVIMNNSHSAREAIEDGYNGILCKENDINSWLQAINKLAKYKDIRQKFGKNSRKKVKEEFNWEQSVNRHYQFFKQAIS